MAHLGDDRVREHVQWSASRIQIHREALRNEVRYLVYANDSMKWTCATGSQRRNRRKDPRPDSKGKSDKAQGKCKEKDQVQVQVVGFRWSWTMKRDRAVKIGRLQQRVTGLECMDISRTNLPDIHEL